MPGPVTPYPGGYFYKPTVADVVKISLTICRLWTLYQSTPPSAFDAWIANTYKASSPKKAVNFVVEHLQGLINKSLSTNDFSREAGWGDVEFYAAFGSQLVGETLLHLPASLKHDSIGGYSDPSKINFLSYGGFYKPENGDGYTLAVPQEIDS